MATFEEVSGVKMALRGPWCAKGWDAFDTCVANGFAGGGFFQGAELVADPGNLFAVEFEQFKKEADENKSEIELYILHHPKSNFRLYDRLYNTMAKRVGEVFFEEYSHSDRESERETLDYYVAIMFLNYLNISTFKNKPNVVPEYMLNDLAQVCPPIPEDRLPFPPDPDDEVYRFRWVRHPPNDEEYVHAYR